jgi:RES domain-containing protein
VILWRISRHLDLSGIGGLRAPGRWHHAGHPIVYLAGSTAAALLEVCVHTTASNVPPDFTLLKIVAPDGYVPAVGLADLPKDWRVRFEITRNIGTAWLRRKESALLRVPSAVAPQTGNFLFNPTHSAAPEFRIAEILVYPFDRRLKE